MILRGRRVPLSTQFEEAAEQGRVQARASGSPWAQRLRSSTVAELAPTSREARTRGKGAGRGEHKPNGKELKTRGTKGVGRKRKQGDQGQARQSRRGAVDHEEEEKGRIQEATATHKRGWKSKKTRQAATTSEESETDGEGREVFDFDQPELPGMAEEELGPYAAVEETGAGDAKRRRKEGPAAEQRRVSNTAERYGQKQRDMSPKTPSGAKAAGEQGKGEGEHANEGHEEVPRGSSKGDGTVVSPGTVVKYTVGTKGQLGSAFAAGAEEGAGVTSPAGIKALKATFELGVRAELEARREETARHIEADRERMKAHEVALRKRVREREEAEADRDRAVLEVEEYVTSKKRAAEELERRAKRAREEAEEAENERNEARQRAEREFEKRIAALDLDEERRAIEQLRAAIAEREKTLRASEGAEAEAVGVLVTEQLAELQRKVDKIWAQQQGTPNGA